MRDFLSEYYPILLFVFVSAFVSFIFFFVSYIIIFKNRDIEKLSVYECGFSPFETEGRSRFDIKFYVVGILFIIFDLEIAFFFPWIVAIDSIGYVGYISMITFLFLLLIAFIYEWRVGVLEWGNVDKDHTSISSWKLQHDFTYKVVTSCINHFKLFRKSHPGFSELLKVFF